MFKFSTKIEKIKELTSQLDEYYQYSKFKRSIEDKDKWDIQIYNYLYDERVSLPEDLNRELIEIIELKILERVSKLEGEIEARLK